MFFGGDKLKCSKMIKIYFKILEKPALSYQEKNWSCELNLIHIKTCHNIFVIKSETFAARNEGVDVVAAEQSERRINI